MSKATKAERIVQAMRVLEDRYAVPESLEAAILAFQAKKVYGVRRWDNGSHDARMFIINSVLRTVAPLQPTREEFVKITGDGDEYDLIVSPPDDADTKQRARIRDEMENPRQPTCKECHVPMDRTYEGAKVVGYHCVVCGMKTLGAPTKGDAE